MSTTEERPEDVRAAALANWLREQPINRRVRNTLLRDQSLLRGLDRDAFVSELYRPDGGAVGAVAGIGAKTLAALRGAIPAPGAAAAAPEQAAGPGEAEPPPDDTLAALVAAADGLLMPSESDYPFTPVRWSGEGPPTSAALLADMGVAPGSVVETRSLDEFFAPLARVADWMDEPRRAQVERFAELRDLFAARLANIKVYRIGERKIAVIIAGQDASGATVGLRTTVIET